MVKVMWFGKVMQDWHTAVLLCPLCMNARNKEKRRDVDQ
jgi:hypothetical protein